MGCFACAAYCKIAHRDDGKVKFLGREYLPIEKAVAYADNHTV
jgi:hypothetical protein